MRLLSHGSKLSFAAALLLLGGGWPGNALAATECINAGAPTPLEICVKDDGTPAVWVAQPNGRVAQYYGNDDWGSVIWLDKDDPSTSYATEYAQQFGTGQNTVTPVSNVLTGAGTSADPYAITTVFDLGASGVRVTQVFSYVNGDRSLRKLWSLANTGARVYSSSRFFHGGDTTFGGSDFARSWYDAGNTMVYVTNPNFTNSGLMGFYANPATPAAAYFGGNYFLGQLIALGYDLQSGTPIEPQLPDTADSNFDDGGYQLQWDRASLAPGQTWNIEAFETWSAPGALQVLSPADGFVFPGTTVHKTFKVHNLTAGSLAVTLAAVSTPAGWTVSLPNGSSLNLNSLEAKEVAVDITVPANAAVGASRDIALTATSGIETGSGSTRLTILQTDYTLAPTALEFQAGGGTDKTVTLSNAANGSPVDIGQIAGANALATPFSITADSCSNTTVSAGASCSITVHFAPANGNLVDDTFDWPVLAPVITSQTITVSGNVAPASHTVQTSPGAGGSIAPTSAVINHGSTTSFTATPAAGYSIASVTGCGGALVGNTYTTGVINAACTVTASFSLNSYAVTASASQGGSIDPSNATVSHGSTTSFTLTPNAGFSIAGALGCGGTLTDDTYVTGPITAACTVSASFVLNQYAVTAIAEAGGSVSPGTATKGYGSTASFTITPDAGYSITTVTGCGGVLSGNTYTTPPLTSSCAFTARFAITPPTFDPALLPAHERNATALFFELPQSIAPRAFDSSGGELSVSLVGGRTQYPPGEHTLIWRAIDDRGVEATVQQILRIWPTVSLGPDVSLGFLQGNSTSFRIALNGAAPQAPFTVGYTVTGYSTGHDLESGSVQFGTGETEKEVFFAITETPATGTPSQNVEVELNDDMNRGERRRLTVHLLAQNAAPVVALVARQAEEIVPVFDRAGAPVTIVADVRDPNSADTHTVEWIYPAGAMVTAIGTKLTLQPDSLPAGIHRFEAVVTDNGAPSLSTHGVLTIVLAEAAASLPAGASSWADNGLPDHVDYNPSQRSVLPEHEHDLTRFLIEGAPGLHLSLGPYALQEQRFQAELPGDSIGADTVTNVGGYFDFTVSDLSAVGQSVNIVIPQQAPIPANAVYRKYDLLTQHWKNFVENSNNALASAPGAEGLCPPPGSDAFRPGLNVGDWCVRLTLSDGGPNDGDARENGVVADPGGVGALATVVVTTRGKGGGGAFDPLLLFLGGALLMLRGKSRSLIIATTLVAGSATAAAQNAWYGGVQFGPARGDVSESDVNARLADAGYDATAAFTDLDRNAWRFYAGCELTPHLGIEAAYTDLGEVSTRLEGNVVDIEEFLASANELHPHSARGFEVGLHGRYPLTQRISVGARGGILRWRSRYRATNQDGEFNRLKDDGAGAFVGVGVEFAVYRLWSIGVDWTSYRINDESIGFVGFGVSYRLN